MAVVTAGSRATPIYFCFPNITCEGFCCKLCRTGGCYLCTVISIIHYRATTSKTYVVVESFEALTSVDG